VEEQPRPGPEPAAVPGRGGRRVDLSQYRTLKLALRLRFSRQVNTAAPLTKRQRTGHIESIQTAKIIKALSDHVHKGTDMLPTQIKAAEILLKKTVPDLKAVDLTGNLDVNGSWTVKLS